MEATKTTPRDLVIDGMTGDACVQKITGSLRAVPGLTNQSVKLGGATFNADQTGFDAAHAAIGAAGFKSHEKTHSAESTGADGIAPKPGSDHNRSAPNSPPSNTHDRDSSRTADVNPTDANNGGRNERATAGLPPKPGTPAAR